jgi:hypothetical protein
MQIWKILLNISANSIFHKNRLKNKIKKPPC